MQPKGKRVIRVRWLPYKNQDYVFKHFSVASASVPGFACILSCILHRLSLPIILDCEHVTLVRANHWALISWLRGTRFSPLTKGAVALTFELLWVGFEIIARWGSDLLNRHYWSAVGGLGLIIWSCGAENRHVSIFIWFSDHMYLYLSDCLIMCFCIHLIGWSGYTVWAKSLIAICIVTTNNNVLSLGCLIAHIDFLL